MYFSDDINLIITKKQDSMAKKKLARVLALEKGNTRLAAVKSIDMALDLGNEITIENYETELTLLASKLSSYNTALSTVDNLRNECMAQIEVVKDWNERVLTGVATR